jgi:pyruvate dehydrogenase (quinone)
VLEVKTDPEIAPLPPNVSLAEARKFLSSVAREKVALHTFGDTARQAINAVFEKAD